MLRYLRKEAGISLWDALVRLAYHCFRLYACKSPWALTNIADPQNLAALNVCRGIVGAGAAVIIPAAAGMIGSIYPPGRKRTFAFVAVSCGQSSSYDHLSSLRIRAHVLGGVSGASIGMLIAGAFLEYNRFVPTLLST